MALVRFQRRPLRAPAMVDELENRMRKFFDDGLLSVDNDLLPQAVGFSPAMDIVETADVVTLTAELPGLDRKDVDISIDDGMLTVTGEKSDERTVENAKYHFVERSYGTFQRSFALPRTVDASKVTAEFGKGILTVTMPKTSEAKAKGRKIEVTDKK